MTDDIPVATYARTSDEKQQSCDAQLGICRNVAKQRGMRLAFQLKDEGMRGARPDRPGYMRLLELAKERRIKAVIIWKLDRLFRSMKEASATQELFAKYDVAIISATEPFDSSTAIGKLVFGFLTNLGQFETELIRERALLGYSRRVMEAKWTGANVPFGYLRNAQGRLQVNEDEAKVLRKMHSHYGRVQGDAQMARWLNERGITWRGKDWLAERVRRVLTNPICYGELTMRGLMQFHADLVIISKARFAETATIRKGLQHLGKHRPHAEREATINRMFDAYVEALADEEADAAAV